MDIEFIISQLQATIIRLKRESLQNEICKNYGDIEARVNTINKIETEIRMLQDYKCYKNKKENPIWFRV